MRGMGPGAAVSVGMHVDFVIIFLSSNPLSWELTKNLGVLMYGLAFSFAPNL